MWGAKSYLTEAIYERSEWFALFLSNAQERDCDSLVWTAANNMGGEHVGKNIEVVEGVRQKGCEPFQSRALEGGGEGFAEDCVLGRVQGDMGDVDFKVLVRVDLANIAVQREGFPLGRKRCIGDKVSEGVATFGLMGMEQMGWDRIVDHSGDGGGKVVREVWVVGRYSGLYGGTCVVCRVVGTL